MSIPKRATVNLETETGNIPFRVTLSVKDGGAPVSLVGWEVQSQVSPYAGSENSKSFTFEPTNLAQGLFSLVLPDYEGLTIGQNTWDVIFKSPDGVRTVWFGGVFTLTRSTTDWV
jgi:hypothetical protein